MDQIFLEFDTDRSNDLNREKTLIAFKKTLELIDKGEIYNYYIFDTIFTEADINRHDKLTRNELK